ncbi:unnamed protein product, partial [Aphanomyces euteiches]
SNYKKTAPYDGNSPGTHTAGTIAGQNGISAAPNAKRIILRGCTTDSCPEATLTVSAQWILYPANCAK